MNTFESLLNQEQLKNHPIAVLYSLHKNIRDQEILNEICSRIDFENTETFLESVKNFFIEYGKNISLGDGIQMADQLDEDEDPWFESFERAQEGIIMTMGRPAFLIRNDRLDGIAGKSIWKDRLGVKHQLIRTSSPNVGRIELENYPRCPWVGTGWLIKGTNIIVTNRHVAHNFASRQHKGFDINMDYAGNELEVRIDFKEEFNVDEIREFKINKVLHIAENDEPDIALLQVNTTNQFGMNLPEGLEVHDELVRSKTKVFVLGYPANHSFNEVKIYDFIFKGISDVKRLAPGEISPTNAASFIYMHDCSTWYGNSGSPIIDFETGKVVGIHYAGSHHELDGIRGNWAVSSKYLIELLEELNIPYGA